MTVKIKFTKMHGLENDFVIIDNTHYNLELSAQQVQFICHRKLGIGCDQLLLIAKRFNLSNEYDYRIFNSDGSTANHCGNGARCIIKYLYLHDKDIDQTQAIILNMPNRIISGTSSAPYDEIEVTMGNALFAPADIPFVQQLSTDNIYQLIVDNNSINFSVANVGNPHAIVYLAQQQQLTDMPSLAKIATTLQQSAMFPDNVNVNFCYIINESKIELITYERGVGFTRACGSGACATVATAINQKRLDKEVLVQMPGGTLKIKIDEQQQIHMIGAASYVFEGHVQLCT